MKYYKCMKNTETTSEYIKLSKELHEKFNKDRVLQELDCVCFAVDKETEKAYGFDFGIHHDTTKYRFCYAPKSLCKEVKNDYFIGPENEKAKFVLVPRWIFSRW